MKKWFTIVIHDQWMPTALCVGIFSWIYYPLKGDIYFPVGMDALCLVVLASRILRAYLIMRRGVVCLGTLTRENRTTYKGLAEHRVTYHHGGESYQARISYNVGVFPENGLVTLYVDPLNPARCVVYEIQDIKDTVRNVVDDGANDTPNPGGIP